ncbi:unnamed protein product [Prorocentrum cordatum]|uniref:Uncharacterized protein n=1 Tax=Prorocentrum cordatum TaxID=2364126 RepID=A0ABN9X1L3_9DINO|nr:unnamed protein product [Polarella glacialis]
MGSDDLWERMAALPVAQAAFGAAAAALGGQGGTKALSVVVAAAARGAAQGAAAGAAGAGAGASDCSGGAKGEIELLAEVLDAVGEKSNLEWPISVQDAKGILRDGGARSLASRLGRLSKARNARGHPDVSLAREVRAHFVAKAAGGDNVQEHPEPIARASTVNVNGNGENVQMKSKQDVGKVKQAQELKLHLVGSDQLPVQIFEPELENKCVELQMMKAELAAETAARAASASEVEKLQQQVVALHTKLDSNAAKASEYKDMVAGLEAELAAAREAMASATTGSQQLAEQIVELQAKKEEAEQVQMRLREALADAERRIEEESSRAAEAVELCQGAFHLAREAATGSGSASESASRPSRTKRR